jgi:hypothetical protein
MEVSQTKNYILYSSISNFETQSQELDFGDFKIISLKQGSDAVVEWREKLRCKRVPKNILIKEFPNYKMQEDDFSGYDRIHGSLYDLLVIFRLYKVGDIMFDDVLLEGLESNELISLPKFSAKTSFFTYDFIQDEIENFNDFRNNKNIEVGFKNKYYQFPLDYLMSGCNKAFHYSIMHLERVVDYVVALESLFLIDNKMNFLRRTISERISRFLEDDDVRGIVKFMYDERSNIVHGNNIGLSENDETKKMNKIRIHMPGFEILMRKVFRKLIDLNFSNKKEIVSFMEKLYDVPSESLKIMHLAKLKAEKYL